MKKVYLFTGNDFILQERLIELSCVPVPHEPGAISTFMPDDIAMYQVSDTSLDTVKEYFGANPACTHIFATEEITPLQREFFLQNGIADV
ncbi:MAG: hypothetical protein LBT84_00545, partial [Spirochaetia bacterium]|nr:hypothetical protein [Spirochaetia bacterium]